MLRRLIAFLVGTLRIEVRANLFARFLNAALEHDISLWNIKWMGDRIRATTSVGDFRRIRPVARAARARVRVLARHGLPFAAARLKRRPVLLAGAVACLGFLIWATGHIWVVKVKVTGPQTLDARAVAAVAAEAGLKAGAWRSRVDTQKVQDHIQRRMREVSWAVIRVQGTRAVIEVVEKAAGRRADSEGCINLVARKAGVVEQVIPYQGEPMVKRGDIVRAGDLLVECSLRYWSGGRPQVYPGTPLPPRESTARTFMAQAEVKARITYQVYREVPLVRDVQKPTGRKVTRWVLNWMERPILEGGVRTAQFERSAERRQAYLGASWRNWKSPVELVIVHIDELSAEQQTIPFAAAVKEAQDQMGAQLKWMLGPSDRVLSPLRAEVVERRADRAGIRLSVETLEEIAQPQAGVPSLPGKDTEGVH